MTQYVINTGALPNDGTGDPLRTAFNAVNLNFNQVWNAGPVNSNITIANNTIYTTNTNGNLILNPNGIGLVQANAHVVPDITRVRNLGLTNLRWNTVYSQYIDVVGATISGNVTVGNIFTDGYYYANGVPFIGGDVPGGPANSVQYNSSGNFAGDSGFTYSSATQTLTLSNAVAATTLVASGNVLGQQVTATNGMVLNSKTINEDFELNGFNASSVGPIETAPGVTIDIIDGDWLIS